MASTYSNLKIQLMATGENNTTWGTVTNVNLGTAIEEAIVGSADVTFASANVTLTLTDTNSTQTARNLRLRCVGTTGGATRNLVVPAIEKPYIVSNECSDSILVKTMSGPGVTVPASRTTWVYCDGAGVWEVITHLTNISLGTPLPVTSGGTGSNTASGARSNLGVPAVDGTSATGTWPISVSGNAGTDTNGVYTTGSQTITGQKTFTSPVLLGDGGIAFASDGSNDTGIYWVSDGVIGVACNAVTVGLFNSTGFTGNAGTVTDGVYITGNQAIGGTKTFTDKVLFADTGFSFSSDGAYDTGIYWVSDGVMGVRCNGTTIGQFDTSGFTGNAATATGLSTTAFSITQSGSVLYIAGSGNTGIGTNTPGSKLTVTGVVESTTGGFKFPDGTTQSTAAVSSPVKAWANFSVSGGVVTVNGSSNITSISRTTTGQFSITFTNALGSSTYAVTANYTANPGGTTQNDGQASPYGLSTSGFGLTVMDGAANLRDPVSCYFVVVG